MGNHVDEASMNSGTRSSTAAHSGLIALLERVTAPNRSLDEAICNAVFGKQSWSSPTVDWCRLFHAKPTASIDAALTLVPEGHRWTAAQYGYDEGKYQDGRAGAYIDPPISSYTGWYKGFGATPAIAVCIAALKARTGRR